MHNSGLAFNMILQKIRYTPESAMNTQKALLMVGVKNTTREINDIIVA